MRRAQDGELGDDEAPHEEAIEDCRRGKSPHRALEKAVCRAKKPIFLADLSEQNVARTLGEYVDDLSHAEKCRPRADLRAAVQ